MSDIHKLSGAYALDAVDDLERAAFERHLAECEDCRTEVAGLRETAALLAETAAVTPPPSLRDSVLSGISQVRPLPPIVRGAPAVLPGFHFWSPRPSSPSSASVLPSGSRGPRRTTGR